MKFYIIGTSGSGKSTLAKILSQKTGAPHTELDTLHFLPGWIERPDEDFKADVLKILKEPHWILCGNYSCIQEEIFKAADRIIWLDYPFYKTFWRVTKRTVWRLIMHKSCCNGNYESFWRQFFTKYSIFWWVITTYGRRKKDYLELSKDPSLKNKWITLRNESDVQAFIQNYSRHS